MTPQIYTVDQIAKPAYYDRQPVPFVLNTDIIVGQHSPTVRGSYTPALRHEAFAEQFYMGMFRTVAPTVSDLFILTLSFLPLAGGSYVVQQLIGQQSGGGPVGPVQNASFGLVRYGDTLQITTADQSTGGTVIYRCTAKGCEFLT